jgi:acetyl-CoA acyltransferase
MAETRKQAELKGVEVEATRPKAPAKSTRSAARKAEAAPSAEPAASPPVEAGPTILPPRPDRVAIVAGLRTPFARSWTTLNDVDPVELSTQVARELLFRLELDPKLIDLVTWGTVVPVVRAPNTARDVALNLGIYHVPAFSVSMACASGHRAVASAAEAILNGQADVALAGGVDVISHAPVVHKKRLIDQLQKAQKAKGMGLVQTLAKVNPLDLLPAAPALTERYTGKTMGEHAEEMAQNFSISRHDQEVYSVESHRRAAAATQAGLSTRDMIVVQTPKGPVSEDNVLRADMELDKIRGLKPAFDRKNGTITAATSSALTDGASCVAVMKESRARELGYQPLGFLRSWAFAGQDPRENMLLGNVYSMPKALERAGVTLQDLDVFEIHEAFAAQVLSNLRLFDNAEFFRTRLGRDKTIGEVNPRTMNIWGGSLAYGHPFAATGGRLIMHVLRLLAHTDGEIGGLTTCAAGGLGVSMVFERA